MRFDSIEFKGRLYKLRNIHFGDDFGHCNVASQFLANLLMDETGDWMSEEARMVDEQIIYFVASSQFRLSDERLRRIILSDI